MTAALDTLAQLKLDDGRLWLDAAFDFQLSDVRAALDPDAPPYGYWTRPRGGSKTEDLAAVEVSALLAEDSATRSYWCAADAGQGQLAIDSIAGFARRTPAIGAQLEIQTRRVTALATGAKLDILAADAPGAWGLRPRRVAVDELSNWSPSLSPERLWEAVSSAVAKSDDARMTVATTAGDPTHFAAKVLAAAKASLLWRVSETPGPAPWTDPDRLAEQKARLPDAVYRQLFLNEWTAAEGSFLDPAVVEAAFVLDSPALQHDDRFSYLGALDLGSVNDASVFAIGHRKGDAVVLDRLETWQGSRAAPVDFGAVEDFIVEAHGRFGFRLLADPWQGLQLMQRLRARGVHATEYAFSQASKQRLAQTLLHSLNAGNLRLYEAEGLRDELLGLRLRQSASGAWSFDHGRHGHDDRAVALALMLVGVLETGVSQDPVFIDAGDSITGDLGRLLGDPAGSAYVPSWLVRRW
jgi:hypothetical protein